MQQLTTVIRILVGVIFIISGLVKVNDPSGLAYKMDEFFAVWGWHWATDFALPLSIGMNVLEVAAGVALLLGWMPELVTRVLLLLIVFFTFLTGYAVLSGHIKTCGCFGDCIPLQAHQSFIKDLVLGALIVFLYLQRRHIKPFLPLRANLFALLFSAGFAFWGQLYVLKNLPVKDCLPYAAGNNLLEQMQPPPGSVPDSIAVFYTYRVNGNTITFDAAHFPDDFDESRYTYVSRANRVVRKGNAVPAIQDLAFFNANGTDTTQALLQADRPYLLWFAKDFDGKDPGWFELFAKIYSKAKESGIPLLIVTNQPVAAQLYFNERKNFKADILTCDGTVMKTFLRSPTGLIAMQGAVVKAKWAEANVNDVIRYINTGMKP